MLILSTLVRMSSARYVLTSTYMVRSSGSGDWQAAYARRKDANGSESRTAAGEIAGVERALSTFVELLIAVLVRARMGRWQSQMAKRARAFGRERKKMAEPRGQMAPGGPETLPRLPFPLLDAVPRVAGPELVAAVARERDGDAFTRGGGDAVGRDRRGIAERLVEVPRQAGQELFDPGRDQRGLEAATKVIGNPARLVELVVRLVGEADRGREHFGVARLRHVGDYGR